MRMVSVGVSPFTSADAFTPAGGNAECILLSYDRLRDLALSPPDSLTFIRNVLEEHRS